LVSFVIFICLYLFICAILTLLYPRLHSLRNQAFGPRIQLWTSLIRRSDTHPIFRFLYVVSTAEIVWLRNTVRCYNSWPTVSYPPTGRTREDAEFLSNIAFLCPGTKLVLPGYELGGLQLVPMLYVCCAKFVILSRN